MPDSNLYIGLMSGTSMDGIDAALTDLTGTCRVLHTAYTAYPDELRTILRVMARPNVKCTLDELGKLDQWLGRLFAQAAIELLKRSGYSAELITAIGSHGQTLQHQPTGDFPYTLQIGDPNVIVDTTGITTVADFRRRDMAAGGQGAPLVPAFHAAVFGKKGQDRAIVNIGGIANITVVRADGSIIGFDTGPGNCLMDQWTQHAFDIPYDTDGDLAAGGNIFSDLLTRLLQDTYFHQPHPKSTGPEYFNLDWLQKHRNESAGNPHDILKTLSQLTAVTIAESVKQLLPTPDTVYVCGGGVHNAVLMEALSTELSGTHVETTEGIGIHPDFVEAAAFAWLAKQALLGKSGNVPEATGAGKSVILGGIYRS